MRRRRSVLATVLPVVMRLLGAVLGAAAMAALLLLMMLMAGVAVVTVVTVTVVVVMDFVYLCMRV